MNKMKCVMWLDKKMAVCKIKYKIKIMAYRKQQEF